MQSAEPSCTSRRFPDNSVYEVKALSNVAALSQQGKIGEALKRSVPLLPREVGLQVQAMLSPASLAILASSLVVWAASHAFGVGELADFLLLAAGLGACGVGIFGGLHDLERFVRTAMGASTDRDLDTAAGYFAKAVLEIGVNTLFAFFLKKPLRSFAEADGLAFKNVKPGLVKVPPPPPIGVKPSVTYKNLAGNVCGYAETYGDITINTRLSQEEQGITLNHEKVHAFFSPKLASFRQVRAGIARSGYARSALLRYIEEAIAEGYAQVRAKGFRGVITGVQFPLELGYITAQEKIIGQGVFLGVISVENQTWFTTLSSGPKQKEEQ